MKTKIFQIAAVSSNTNSFGLHGIVIVAKDGLAFEFGACLGHSGQPKLAAGQHVELELVPDTELSTDAVACFDWGTIRVLGGEHFSIEIPRSFPTCPKKTVRTFWCEPASPQNKHGFKHPAKPCAGGFGV